MKGSEFVALYASRGPAAWEAAALEMAKSGTTFNWPLVPVQMTDGTRTLTIFVTSDYFSVGQAGDVLRLPLTPLTAQKIADVFGMVMPTPRMVKAIHEQAPIKLTTGGLVPNRYADLNQYATQNAAIETELASKPGHEGVLTSGHKKDVVLGNQYRPGKVLIYGWMHPVVPPGRDPAPMMTLPWRVQPYSPVHGEGYVDYSHGIRFVSPDADLGGTHVDLTTALTDARFASLLSDEGPLKTTRYNVPRGNVAPVASIPNAPRIVDQGLAWVQEQVFERKD
jgi:hypothetical protein